MEVAMEDMEVAMEDMVAVVMAVMGAAATVATEADTETAGATAMAEVAMVDTAVVEEAMAMDTTKPLSSGIKEAAAAVA